MKLFVAPFLLLVHVLVFLLLATRIASNRLLVIDGATAFGVRRLILTTVPLLRLLRAATKHAGLDDGHILAFVLVNRMLGVVDVHLDHLLWMILLERARMDMLNLARMDHVRADRMPFFEFLRMEIDHRLWMMRHRQMMALVVEIAWIAAQRALLADLILVVEHEAVNLLESLRQNRLHLVLRHIAEFDEFLLRCVRIHQRVIRVIAAFELDEFDTLEADHMIMQRIIIQPRHLGAIVFRGINNALNFLHLWL
mmetsp:Transcript_12383/g.18688  ORF Transcript_12383/g.18688 Transcript_12383/m.18688 type:complete len:253 (-) Transcript_12383:691-1449(-)